MSSNENIVIEKYQDGAEDQRAMLSRYTELEFHYTKKHLEPYITPRSAVIELGCGTGYYGMHFAGRCKSYMGVDLTPGNIALFQEKIQRQGLQNVAAQIGDATHLTGIPDNRFDVVLCLGPMYHLPPEERELVFTECKRICKDGGTAAFAYINKVGVYIGACVHDQAREIYPNEQANHAVLQCGKDDLRPDLFFYSMPEEMEQDAARHGFRKLKNLGTDFFLTMSIVEQMDDEKFGLLKPLLDQMTSHESCTGMSNHALLVCQKETRP